MRYLIFAASSIGDTIFELALAKGLKHHYEDAYVALLVTSSNASSATPRAVCACSCYVDEVLEFGSHSVPNLMATVLRFRAKRFDYSFFCTSNFKATDKPVVFSRAIGCKSISKDFGEGFAKANYSIEIDDGAHIIQQYESLVRVLFTDAVLDGRVLDRDKALGNSGGKPRLADVAICIGTNITIYRRGSQLVEKNIKKWSSIYMFGCKKHMKILLLLFERKNLIQNERQHAGGKKRGIQDYIDSRRWDWSGNR